MTFDIHMMLLLTVMRYKCTEEKKRDRCGVLAGSFPELDCFFQSNKS
jgi:hypothetical protein